MKKRMLALLLTVCMLASVFPTSAFALPEDGAACICTTHCEPGAEKTDCPVCAAGGSCAAAAPAVQPVVEAVTEPAAEDENQAPAEASVQEEQGEAVNLSLESAAPVAEAESLEEPEASTSEREEAQSEAEGSVAEPEENLEETAAQAANTQNGISVFAVEKPNTNQVDTYEFYVDDVKQENWTQTVKAGDTLVAPPSPTAENKKFLGWYEGDTKVSFGAVSSTTGGTHTVKAKFEEVSYVMFLNGTGTVCYTAEGAKGGQVTDEDIQGAIDAANRVVTPGSAVVGWSSTEGGTQLTAITFGTGVTYVYPVTKAGFWVTFDTAGGEYIAPKFYNETANLSEVTPIKPGYTFDGWADESEKPVTNASSAMTVTAMWTASRNTKYTVIHWQENADDDEYAYKESETKTGTTGAETRAVAKSYQGFTAQTVTQQTIAGDGSTIVNVYYKRNEYTITFHLDDPGYTCGKEAHKHTDRCYWMGWLMCGKEAHSHTSACGGTSQITITAKHGANISTQWPTVNGSNTWKTSPDGNTYQVNIDVMPIGGDDFYGPKTGNGSETAYYYVEVLPGETGTTYHGVSYKEHHHDTSPGTGYTVSKEDKYAITGFTYKEGTQNKSSYNNAKFYYTRNSYNIVFINNGSTVKEVSRKYEQSIADINYTPTRPAGIPASYVFDGWYTNELGEGAKYDFTGKTMPAQNITLYAKWVAPTITATVHLTVEGGNTRELTVPYGQALTEAEGYAELLAAVKAANDGQEPTAWYVVDGAGKKSLFNLATKLTASVTLIPFFGSTSAGHQVTYVEGETEWTDEKTYEIGAYADVRTPKSQDNFLYWTDGAQTYAPGDKLFISDDVTLTAVYAGSLSKLTLTYHFNDGTGTDRTFKQENIPANTTVTVKTLAQAGFTAPEGKEFAGWSTTANGGVEYNAGDEVRITVNGNNDLYAVWTEIGYSVTYLAPEDTNWGTSLNKTDQHAGDTIAIPDDEPHRTGYNFAGWKSSADESKLYHADETFTMPAKNVTLTAQWTKLYTVKWVNEDNTEIKSIEVAEGTVRAEVEAKKPANPTKAADAKYTYTFSNWLPSDTSYATVQKDIVYTPNFTKTARPYDVTYNANGGTFGTASNTYVEQDVAYGTSKTLTNKAPTRKGYTFTGWTSEDVTGFTTARKTGTFTMPAKNVTFQANWKQNDYKVTYIAAEDASWTNSEDKTDAHYQETISVTTKKPTRAGYTFAGWKSSVDSNTYQAKGTFTMPAEDVTLTAQWTANDQTLTYNLNGGKWDDDAIKAEQTYKTGDKVTVAKAPTKEGYTFTGWKRNNTTTYQANDTFTMPAEDVTLTAQWTANNQTLTYDLNGGKWDDETIKTKQTYKTGATVTVEAAPKKEGYTFTGWTYSENIKLNEDGKTFPMPASDATITANWKINTYTVRWVDHDGTPLETDSNVPYGTTPSYDGATPTRAASDQYTYEFSGWYSEGKKVTDPVTEDVTYIAQYTETLIPTTPPSPSTSPEPTVEPTPTPTVEPTPTPTVEPTPIPTVEPTPTPTVEPTPTPTVEPTPSTSPEPTPSTSPEPTPSTSPEPTPSTSPEPSTEPSAEPSTQPSATPTPSNNPAPAPTRTPTTPNTPANNTPAPVPAAVTTPTPSNTPAPSQRPAVSPAPSAPAAQNNGDDQTETIPDDQTHLAGQDAQLEDIQDDDTPLAGGMVRRWALINLLLAILTVLVSVLLLIGYMGKKKKAMEDEDGNEVLDEDGNVVYEYTKKKKGFWRVFSLIPAIVSVIAFILTEDITLPMTLIDRWTLLMVIIALVQVVVMILCKKRKDKNDEEDEQNENVAPAV